jgi:hypothetical protein
MKQHKEQLEGIFTEWREKSPQIASSFKKRDRKSAKDPMYHLFVRFLEALYIGNGYAAERVSSDWKNTLMNFQNKPVNAIERLSFIEEQPDHYQSFIQLSELFSEWEKRSVILMRRGT